MGYEFSIGEATLQVVDVDEGRFEVGVYVPRVELASAPSFPGDALSGQSNQRSPSYTVWSAFCREEGLYQLFYNDRGNLHGGHPGAVLLTDEWRAQIRAALERHVRLGEPGWCECARCDPFSKPLEFHQHTVRDGNLARLLWLQWWVDWALKTCQHPTIHNH